MSKKYLFTSKRLIEILQQLPPDQPVNVLCRTKEFPKGVQLAIQEVATVKGWKNPPNQITRIIIDEGNHLLTKADLILMKS